MKKFALIAAALLVGTAAAYGADGATYQLKTDGTNVAPPPEGNPVAYYSSNATGNGAVVGGNGTNGGDQTTTPGSRAEAVQALLATSGKGRDGH